jgi:type I restriction enzyme, S subunit
MSAEIESMAPQSRHIIREQPALILGFEVMATSRSGAAKLRELILTLAAQGKLVSQDQGDEPAAELLKRINANRLQLVGNKQLRSRNALPPMPVDEQTYSLPTGWAWTRLGDIGDWGAGATPSRTKAEYYGGDVPWFKSGELTADFISRSDETVTALALKECSLRPNRSGDVLIAMYGATIGKTSILTREGTTNQAVCACTPFDGLDNRYLLLALKALRPYFIGKGAGGAQPNISREKIVSTVIGLPPLAEQQRIVARVEELMKLCDALEQSGRLADEQHARLTSTLFDALAASESAHALAENWQRVAEHFDLLLDRPEAVDAFEQTIVQLAVRGLLAQQDREADSGSALLVRFQQAGSESGKRAKAELGPLGVDDIPFSTPEVWAWARLGDVVDVTGGVTLGRKGALANPLTLPYLRVANVQRGHLNLATEVKTVSIDAAELSRFQLKAGDLLITEGGDWDKVGRTCIWRNEIPTCLHQNHIFRARGRTAEWSPEWGQLYLNSADARAYFASSAKQTTNLASINMTQLRYCALPLPPLAEQNRIVARVEELRQLCADLRRRLAQAQEAQSKLADALVTEVA